METSFMEVNFFYLKQQWYEPSKHLHHILNKIFEWYVDNKVNGRGDEAANLNKILSIQSKICC
jgi:hypothetical protein